jgi:uncharacterized damage-inducible protein DinB
MPDTTPTGRAIKDYLNGIDKLRVSVAGLDDKQLDAFPVEGTWSIRQIVAHTVHMDAVACDRMMRVLAENVPLLVDVDENAAIKAKLYEKVPIDGLLDLFETHRQLLGHILKSRPASDFDRVGIHTQVGRVTLMDILSKYINHLDHHVGFIEKKRTMLK